MQKINYSLIITIVSIILSAGTTIGYIKATMRNMQEQLIKLTNKVEAHNNYGLRIVELETKVAMLEKQAERRNK